MAGWKDYGIWTGELKLKSIKDAVLGITNAVNERLNESSQLNIKQFNRYDFESFATDFLSKRNSLLKYFVKPSSIDDNTFIKFDYSNIFDYIEQDEVKVDKLSIINNSKWFKQQYDILNVLLYPAWIDGFTLLETGRKTAYSYTSYSDAINNYNNEPCTIYTYSNDIFNACTANRGNNNYYGVVALCSGMKIPLPSNNINSYNFGLSDKFNTHCYITGKEPLASSPYDGFYNDFGSGIDKDAPKLIFSFYDVSPSEMDNYSGEYSFSNFSFPSISMSEYQLYGLGILIEYKYFEPNYKFIPPETAN